MSQEEMPELRLQPINPIRNVDTATDSDKFYEKFKLDGVYQYRILPNGRKDKKHLKITYHDGDIYEGKLEHGKYAGDGKYIWSDGSFYQGNFTKGQIEGKGTFNAANGDIYEGAFKKGNFEGNGRYVWRDGSHFEGTFKNGQLKSGRYTDADGNVYFCEYSFRGGNQKRGKISLVSAAKPQETVSSEQSAPATVPQPAAAVPEASVSPSPNPEPAPKRDAQTKGALNSRDKAVLTSIRKSAKGPEFKKLVESKLKTATEEKQLLKIIGFFTRYSKDREEQMQRIFKSTPFYDEKKGDAYVKDVVGKEIERNRNYIVAVSSKNRVAAGQQQAQQRQRSASRGAAR